MITNCTICGKTDECWKIYFPLASDAMTEACQSCAEMEAKAMAEAYCLSCLDE